MSNRVLSRRPRNYPSGARACAGRAPELSVGGEGALRTGLVLSTPELSVEGPGWLRMWGVAGSPSVDRLAEGDAPSSP